VSVPADAVTVTAASGRTWVVPFAGATAMATLDTGPDGEGDGLADAVPVPLGPDEG